MDKQEATSYVIGELAKHRDKNDIIMELCQKTGGSRDQVQRFVQLVESQNRPATTAVPTLTPTSEPMPVVPSLPPASRPTSTQASKDNALDTPETTAFVVSELARHRHRNDIIMTLCEKTGSSWDQVQRFVRRVESENRQTITARQSPILIMIGVITIVSGLLLAAYTVVRTLNGYAWGLPGMPIPYLGNLAYAATGLGMIGGGTVGTLRTARSLLR